MKKNQTTHRMAKVLMLLFAVLFIVLFGRFFYIQATGEVQGVDLNEWAEKKRTNNYSIDAKRGNILDRNGMTLAYDHPTYNMYAIVDPSYSKNVEKDLHVVDKEQTAEQLATVIDMSEEAILKQLNNDKQQDGTQKFQVEFGSAGRNLTTEQKDKVEAMKLPGIQFEKEEIRYYPNGMFASHIIGFAQNDNKGNIEGVMGIEKQMEKALREKDGHIYYQRDNYNMKLLDPKSIITEPEDGMHVQLTLDQKIQTFLEDALSSVDEKYNPKQIMAVVMDPKTGEVLALGNRPSFDPNDRSGIETWYNDIVSYPIEPGSTMKIFTYAAAIDAGVYNGEEAFLSGQYKYTDKDRPVRDHNPGGWGKISYDEGFERSSNVAVSKLLWEKLGPEKFLEYYEAFNLTKKTGIDLPGERTGRLVYNYPSEQVSLAFGQGSTVTPIQLMMAGTAVANEGKMMRPHVISQVQDSETGKPVKEKEPEVVSQPIKASTSKKVLELMERVVTGEYGTGKMYKLDEYTVGGKTGTAQIPNPETGKYMNGHGNYLYSFLGMAPAEDPELMMFVSVTQPELTLDPYVNGATPVAEIFNPVMENSLRYLDIQPDKAKVSSQVLSSKLDDFVGASVKQAAKAIKKSGAQPIILGDGKKVQQMIPAPGTEILKKEKVFLRTSDQVEMPDMTGWSKRDAYQVASLLGLRMEQSGSGYVYKQSIEPGKKAKKGSYIMVELKAPNEYPPKSKPPENNTE